MFTYLSSFFFYLQAYVVQVITTTQKTSNTSLPFPSWEVWLYILFPSESLHRCPSQFEMFTCAYLCYSIYHFDVIKDLFCWLLMFKVPWGHGLYLLMHLYSSSFIRKLDFKKENFLLGFIFSTKFFKWVTHINSWHLNLLPTTA